MTKRTQAMTLLSFTKRDLIIGATALTMGFMGGTFYEKKAYERKLAEQIMTQITDQQKRLEQSRQEFDQRFRERSDRFSQTFDNLKNNFQKKD